LPGSNLREPNVPRPHPSFVSRAPATLLLLLSPAALHAQSITSDRPGIGSGSAVLPTGIVQLESGVSLSSGTGTDAYSIGQALIRVGFSSLELELFANSFVVARSEAFPASDDEGFQDIGLGVKVPVLREVGGGRMNLSLQGILTAPTGSDSFTNDEWIGGVNALADVSLGDRGGFSANLGISESGGGGAEVISVIVTPGVSLSDEVGAYAGWAGFFSDDGDVNFGEGGLTLLASPDVQLDVNGGWALDGDGWFVGGGVAIRWGAR